MRAESKYICKHCGTEDCFAHCQVNPSGEHEADRESFTPADGYGLADPFIIDCTCKHCGQSGSTGIKPSDIDWD